MIKPEFAMIVGNAITFDKVVKITELVSASVSALAVLRSPSLRAPHDLSCLCANDQLAERANPWQRARNAISENSQWIPWRRTLKGSILPLLTPP